MDKQQLVEVLQACLFSFDGASKEEILNLNEEFDSSLVVVGIDLSAFLKDKSL